MNRFVRKRKTQSLKFGEAVKTLANYAGMQPYTFSKADEERENDWKNYSQIYKDYIEYHNEELLKNPDLNEVRDYLKNRNLNSNDVKNFDLGYVRNKKNFYQELLNKFKEKDLKDSGLFYFSTSCHERLWIARFHEQQIMQSCNSKGEMPRC